MIKPKEILSPELSLVPYSTHSLDEYAKLIVERLCQEALHQFELKEHCRLKISIGMIFLPQHLIKSRASEDLGGCDPFGYRRVGFLLFILKGSFGSSLLTTV